MTAPNKMAKRAAAGTLALAVCLGGGILGAGAANAALPAGPGVVTVATTDSGGNALAAPVLVKGGAAKALNPITIDLGADAWSTDDTVTVAVPEGYTLAGTIVDAAEVTGATGSNNADVATAVTTSVGSGGRLLTIAFATSKANIASLDATKAVKLTLTGVTLAANSTVAVGTASATVQGVTATPGQSTAYKSYSAVTLGTVVATANPISIGSGQSVLTNGSVQALGDITITESAAGSLTAGTYGVRFYDSAGTPAQVAVETTQPSDAASKTSVAVSPTGSGVTVGAATLSATDIQFTTTGTSTGPVTLTLKNARIKPVAANTGPIKVELWSTGGGAAKLSGATSTIAAGASTTRTGGIDRFATAAQIAGNVEAAGAATNVVLTNGGYNTSNGQSPDALTANYVAGRLAEGGAPEVPIILTNTTAVPNSSLDALKSALKRNATDTAKFDATITILGGTSAVSQAVVDQLRAELPSVTIRRLDGADRYETAANAVTDAAAKARAVSPTDLPRNYTPTFGEAALPTAVIAAGANSADALTAGAVSYSENLPLLLTEKTALSASTKGALAQLGIKRVVLLGGEAAISASVTTELEALGIKVHRDGGADRFETAQLYLSRVVGATASSTKTTNAGMGVNIGTTGYLVNGDLFADALVAGPWAGKTGAVLLLSQAASVPTKTNDFIKSSTITSITPIGTTNVLSDASIKAASDKAAEAKS